ncbi:MAG: methionine ABC transporter substrate-binding protein [Propionibacteriaceae bacterium]|jgi:D-methionine transport system substrate-binding protein|nr:methionine ABC transporter substrate-binding protein [Propionibacteriaceae bacterium]
MSETKAPSSRSKRGVLQTVGAVAASFALLFGAVGCSEDEATPSGTTTTTAANEKGSEANPVKLGVVGAEDEYWETYVDAAKAEGIYVELVNFSEYPLPNPALSAGDLDLNQFQHIIYLATYIAETGKELSPIGATAIYPLGLYSLKYKSVDEIPDGSEIAIPDDPSNQARALLVLQSAGLLKITGGGSIFSTVADIDTDNSRVTVIQLAGANTPSALQDVAAAIINNDFVEDAGLNFADAIAKDDPSDPNALPYVNIFASRPEDKTNPTYLKLVSIFQNTTSVTEGLQENSGGTAVLLKTPVADLEASLAKVVADNKAQNS